ncbi:lysophospholipid transporter LplT [Paraburkholderia sp. SIMBA_055]|jgi:MFS family permease|uniref:Major facilitator superfamily MFS_1 n=2 Tax=Paraburkholderia graminis TaxID=60548 RepID=B1GAP4_PARG4|nr:MULTISPECIES: lysophospholipid transporter LplT [Paraburkholderia]ALE55011.1 major facilitator transporter [Burkholderia sp. HB1]AXF08287.1 lysophospholipid transporter LplT [Paraburkholderia graminis]EDT06802.1 major facilitator superfamily MFS_1 [Paraburkholderia graminis C4D1M]MDQ0623451.1 LPLT family lysophospholipid transporter-like MFS transporter [Paraburkholderia graminis]MDR6203574.1 LPLT family lysophospholipid transporter-like MFS transporter [Paraburkholderia graminis]
MKKGFYTIMAAQFFSSLADNALLIAAIALLKDLHAPNWMTPLLKLFFVLSYVVLAAFVGAFADSRPKGRVMFITNTIKVLGCITMLVGAHPLIAYGIVGFGAAAYSPAKYGILTELLPPDRLVAANGWIEGTTVGSIILGTVLGGALISPHIAAPILRHHIPTVNTPAEAAMLVIMVIYVIAALFNLRIPDTGARYPKQQHGPIKLVTDFADCFVVLWRDKLGQISLAVTTLFWGAGATLQFIVLKWAEVSLGMSLSEAAILQAVVAVGVAAGAIFAASRVPLKKSLSVLPVGIMMGIAVMLMAFYTRHLFPAHWGLYFGRMHVPGYLIFAYIFLMIVGGLSGFFVVPMNALLQHRGHVLLSAGHSIAVQNFNENLSVLVMLCLYAVLVWLDVPVAAVIVLFGTFVCVMMWLVMRRHQANQRAFDSVALIGEVKH